MSSPWLDGSIMGPALFAAIILCWRRLIQRDTPLPLWVAAVGVVVPAAICWWLFVSSEAAIVAAAVAAAVILWVRFGARPFFVERWRSRFASTIFPVVAAIAIEALEWLIVGHADVSVALLTAAFVLSQTRVFSPMVLWLERLLDVRAMPVFLGIASAALILWIWGTLRPVPVIHDESMYLFQAEVFAHGHWTAPPAPLPGFFDQLYLLSTSTGRASKYPPGHSLLIVPGVWLGLPGLVPVMLTGAAGGLVYLLGRRMSGPWVGFFAWLLWTTASDNLRFRHFNLSELTTSFLWLVGWWALDSWARTGKKGWLFLLSAAAAWGAVTRPLTMLVWGLPTGTATIVAAAKRRNLADLIAPAGLGLAILGLVPIWSACTTGDWRTTPLVVYNRTYMPNDLPGLSPNFPSALAALPADQAAVNEVVIRLRHRKTLQSLPRLLIQRSTLVAAEMWGNGRWTLFPFAVAGLLFLGAGGWVAVLCSAFLVVGYLVHTHEPGWTLYYLEASPGLALVTAMGVGTLFGATHDKGDRSDLSWSPGGGGAVLLLSLTLLLPAASDASRERIGRSTDAAGQHDFRERLDALPDARVIVFVRYGPKHNSHLSLITNEPDLQRSRFWIVYDRGAENARLLALAPDRAAYLYDEASRTLRRLPRV